MPHEFNNSNGQIQTYAEQKQTQNRQPETNYPKSEGRMKQRSTIYTEKYSLKQNNGGGTMRKVNLKN